MATAAEWESTKMALGPLLDDPRVTPYLSCNSPADLSWVDFVGLYESEQFFEFTALETSLLLLAKLLYTGRNSLFRLDTLLEWADDETWQRCMNAILIRRGCVDGVNVLPGNFVG